MKRIAYILAALGVLAAALASVVAWAQVGG